jgi:hypothetical protein
MNICGRSIGAPVSIARGPIYPLHTLGAMHESSPKHITSSEKSVFKLRLIFHSLSCTPSSDLLLQRDAGLTRDNRDFGTYLPGPICPRLFV